jgi:hypothetical protein
MNISRVWLHVFLSANVGTILSMNLPLHDTAKPQKIMDIQKYFLREEHIRKHAQLQNSHAVVKSAKSLPSVLSLQQYVTLCSEHNNLAQAIETGTPYGNNFVGLDYVIQPRPHMIIGAKGTRITMKKDGTIREVQNNNDDTAAPISALSYGIDSFGAEYILAGYANGTFKVSQARCNDVECPTFPVSTGYTDPIKNIIYMKESDTCILGRKHGGFTLCYSLLRTASGIFNKIRRVEDFNTTELRVPIFLQFKIAVLGPLILFLNPSQDLCILTPYNDGLLLDKIIYGTFDDEEEEILTQLIAGKKAGKKVGLLADQRHRFLSFPPFVQREFGEYITLPM